MGAGVLYAIGYPDGTKAVFDGQHRLFAMRERRIVTAAVLTFMGLVGDKEAAIIQRLIGHTRRWSPLDEFKLKLRAEDPIAVAINRTLETYGARIDRHATAGYASVKQLQQIHDWTDPKRGVLGHEVLAKTVQTIEQAWSAQGALARSSVVIRATGFLYYSFPDANPDWVASRLSTLVLATTKTTAQSRLYPGDSLAAELTSAFLRHVNKTPVDGKKLPDRLRLPRGFRKS
jgi:hypothetical protein